MRVSFVYFQPNSTFLRSDYLLIVNYILVFLDHFPTACTLLAYGEIMVSCCPIGRMSEFVFAPTPTALRIVEDIRKIARTSLFP